jgi:hypothetical protein
MKHLFVKGYLEGKPVQHVMVDGRAGINVMPMAMFEKMGYKDSELMKTKV